MDPIEIFGLTLELQPLIDEIKEWWETLLRLLPNILLAIIVGLFGYILTKFLKKYIGKASHRMISSSSLADLLANVLTILLALVFLLIVLSILQLDGIVKAAVAGAGVVGLALGIAFQDPLLNFFSGIILTLRHLFEKGDLIEVDGFFGKVREITLRHTTLETLQGQDVMIPNKIMAQSPLKNFSKLRKRRVDLACGVSYGEDLERVKKLTLEAIESSVPHDREKGVELFFNEFGDSSINYTLRFWLDQHDTAQKTYLAAQSDAVIAIKKCYDANDIMIPFPIRTLDFGIKGGEKLNEVLGGSQVSDSGDYSVHG